MKWRLVGVCGLLCLPAASAPVDIQPLELSASSGLEVEGQKDGGVAWGDIDGDGCLDAAINTTERGTVVGRQQGCTGKFTIIAELSANRERSVLFGDIDNDGDLDLVRNTSSSIDVHLNTGARPWFTAAPTYLLAGAINSEGLGLIDHDGDGDLDLVSDNHQFGVQLYENRDASGQFTVNEFSGLPLGTQLGPGDYLAVADIEPDGDVDVLVRRNSDPDVFINNGGRYLAGQDVSISPGSTVENKGGASLCDLDDDGDLDAFWTDDDASNDPQTNRILRWEDGQFSAIDSEVSTTGNIDGVSCGDVDNDGDLDLVLIADGPDQLLVNHGDFRFERTELPGTGSDGEGSSLADIDRDGDLDLLVNQDGAAALFKNSTNDQRYLVVDLRSGQRSAIGASARLETCAGAEIGGLREVSGGSGHGSQDGGQVVHFGGVDPDQQVVVAARFIGGRVIRHATVPRDLGPYQRLTIDEAASDDLGECGAKPFNVTQNLTLQSAGAFRTVRNIVELNNAGLMDAEALTLELSGPSGLTWDSQTCTSTAGSSFCFLDRLGAEQTELLTFEAAVAPSFAATVQPIVKLRVAGKDRGEFVAEPLTVNALPTNSTPPRTTSTAAPTTSTVQTTNPPTSDVATSSPPEAPVSSTSIPPSSVAREDESLRATDPAGTNETTTRARGDSTGLTDYAVALLIAMIVLAGTLTLGMYREARGFGQSQ